MILIVFKFLAKTEKFIQGFNFKLELIQKTELAAKLEKIEQSSRRTKREVEVNGLRNKSINQNQSVDWKPRKEQDLTELGKLMQKEKRSIGTIGYSVYKSFFSYGGKGTILITNILFFMVSFIRLSSDWCVVQVTNHEIPIQPSIPKQTYLLIYCFLCLGSLLMSFISVYLLGYFCSKSSVEMFKTLLSRLLQKPMSFYDTNSSGVLLNRSINDIELVDFLLFTRFNDFYQSISLNLSCIVLSLLVASLLFPIILITFVVFGRVYHRYVVASCELLRLQQISKSPVLTKLSEITSGEEVTRCYGHKQRLIDSITNDLDVF